MPFCRECGKPVEQEWNTCPFCSATIGSPNLSTEVSDSVVMGDINNNQKTINIQSLNISSEVIRRYNGELLQNALSRYASRNVEIKEGYDLSGFMKAVEYKLELICEDGDQKTQLLHDLQFLKLGHVYSISCPSDWSFDGFKSFQTFQELGTRRLHEIWVKDGKTVGEYQSPWAGNELSGGLYTLVGYDLVSNWVFVNLTRYEAVKPDDGNHYFKLITGIDSGLYAITLKEFSNIYKNSNQMICRPPLGITDWKKRRLFDQ
jgi:RNA polymerase subunit RPABC4/transcription elongation factor Spt4